MLNASHQMIDQILSPVGLPSIDFPFLTFLYINNYSKIFQILNLSSGKRIQH